MLHLPYRELPAEDPGAPDLRSPLRYLAWLARRQKGLLALNAVFGIGWMVAQALLWAAVGGAIDHGVEGHSVPELAKWVGVVVTLGLIQAVCGALRHQLAVTNWMNASYRTVQFVGRHLSSAGSAVTDVVPAGDVVNTVAADAMRVGGAFDSLARFLGAILAWIVVSFILLSTSIQLGLIVLIGVPILAALTTPLMAPLHQTQAAQREAAGRLAALGSDTVAGLRILRGIGGEEVFLDNYRHQSARVRDAGFRIASPQAGLESGQVLLPAVLTGVVTWLGARDVMDGTLQVGPAGRLLRLLDLPDHAAAHRDRLRHQLHARLRRRRTGPAHPDDPTPGHRARVAGRVALARRDLRRRAQRCRALARTTLRRRHRDAGRGHASREPAGRFVPDVEGVRSTARR